MKNLIIKSTLALSLVASSSLFANETSQVKAPAPQGSWLSFPFAGSLPAGVVLNNYLFSQHTVKDMTLPINDSGATASGQKQKTTLINAVFRIGLGAGFDVRTLIPFPLIKNQTAGYNINDSGGNAQIIFGKPLLNQRDGDPFTLSPDLGLGVPSAKANEGWGDKYGFRASYLNAPHFVTVTSLGHAWAENANDTEGHFYQATADSD